MNLLSNDTGFTLIEALIATAVLSIGILTLQTMQVTAIKGNAHAVRITTSSVWAGDMLERLYAMPYDDPSVACADDLLCDTDNDGTGQDTDMDGIDTVGADTNFGLADDTAATADHALTSPDGIHTILINIATDQPVPNNKKVRVYVISTQFGKTKRVEYNFIKTDLI